MLGRRDGTHTAPESREEWLGARRHVHAVPKHRGERRRTSTSKCAAPRDEKRVTSASRDRARGRRGRNTRVGAANTEAGCPEPGGGRWPPAGAGTGVPGSRPAVQGVRSRGGSQVRRSRVPRLRRPARLDRSSWRPQAAGGAPACTSLTPAAGRRLPAQASASLRDTRPHETRPTFAVREAALRVSVLLAPRPPLTPRPSPASHLAWLVASTDKTIFSLVCLFSDFLKSCFKCKVRHELVTRTAMGKHRAGRVGTGARYPYGAPPAPRKPASSAPRSHWPLRFVRSFIHSLAHPSIHPTNAPKCRLHSGPGLGDGAPQECQVRRVSAALLSSGHPRRPSCGFPAGTSGLWPVTTRHAHVCGPRRGAGRSPSGRPTRTDRCARHRGHTGHPGHLGPTAFPSAREKVQAGPQRQGGPGRTPGQSR